MHRPLTVFFISMIMLFSFGGCSSDDGTDNTNLIASHNPVETNEVSSANNVMDGPPNWADYEIVLRDEDDWFIFLNPQNGSTRRYSGILYCTYYGYEYYGPAGAYFNSTTNLLNILSEYSRSDRTTVEAISYSQQWSESSFTGSFVYRPYSSYSGNNIEVYFEQGQLGSITAPGGLARKGFTDRLEYPEARLKTIPIQ